MRKLMLVAAVLVAVAEVATAGPVCRVVQGVKQNIAERRAERSGGCQGEGTVTQMPATGYSVSATASVSLGDQTLQAKADAQARAGRCFHPGGGFLPGATFEGVGFSSASPQDALNHCCNNGQAVIGQAVAQGPGGWYAVKQYGPLRTFAAGTLNTVGDTFQSAGQMFQHTGNLILPSRCANGACGR